jgi:hypothetical protein
MANQILLKRKLTSGAPSLAQLAVGEMCLVIPDNAIYWKKDSGTIIGPILIAPDGQMLKNIYDTNNNGNADTSDNSLLLGGAAPSAYALKTYVTEQINALVNGAGATLDTLQELAAALGNDSNFSATITQLIGTKLNGDSTIDGGTIQN